jgi:hypothetical protein
MDRYKIDGLELVQFYNEETKLSKVFTDIENDLKANKQVVCQYIVNGQPILEEDELLYSSWCLDQVDSLEYLTENVDRLVSDVIQGWIDAIPELVTQTEKSAYELKFQRTAKTLMVIGELLDNCNYFVQSMESMYPMLRNSSAAGLGVFTEAEQQTQKALAESLVAFEKKDFVLLADNLEYELISCLELWKKSLENVQQKLKAQSAETNGSSSEQKKQASMDQRKKLIVN